MLKPHKVLFKAIASDGIPEMVPAGQWIKGFYVEGSTSCAIKMGLDPVTVDVRPETVCQYTGIDDRNKLPIFGGDVIRYFISGHTMYGVVIWYVDGWKIQSLKPMLKNPMKFHTPKSANFKLWHSVEVVSNIHQADAYQYGHSYIIEKLKKS